MAADTQPLGAGLDAAQTDLGAGSDPTIPVAVDTLEIVPIAKQMLDVAGHTEIDDIVALARVKLAALARGEQVVNLVFLLGAVPAGDAEQIVAITIERGVAIGTSQKDLEVLQACTSG
jgi:hypothetical protein